MIYDITSSDNAYNWVLEFFDINDNELIEQYILECNSDYDVFIDKQLEKVKQWDLETTDFAVIHVTSSDNECEDIKQNGIINLQEVLSKDTKLKKIFSEYGIQFDINEKLMIIGDKKYNVDYDYYKNICDSHEIEHYKNLKKISRRLYFDAQINGFFFSNDVKRYGTCIHEKPEFMECFHNFLDNISDMERKWKETSCGYKIKYKSKFNEFAWYSFYDYEYSFYDDGENNRLQLKKKLIKYALDICYSKSISDIVAYMKLETQIKNEQILECIKID